MKDDKQAKSPGVNQGGGGRAGEPSPMQSIPLFGEQVNPNVVNTCQAQAGPTIWAVLDSLHSLKHELLSRNLVADGPELDAAIGASYAMMLAASYIPLDELAAVEVDHA